MSKNGETEMTDKVLGLFAKWPAPGMVKSRLAADTSPEWAAGVARAFLIDLVERFYNLHAHRLLVYAPRNEHRQFDELVRGKFDLIPQCDGDLGRRLREFVKEQIDAGRKRIVLVGMDSPTLPAKFVRQAFEHLAETDVVLGPATDGGYYLIGCRDYIPELFDRIAWSGERVLYDTAERIEALKLSLKLLPPWYDVDTLEDWWMLRGHLWAMRLARIPTDTPETEKVVETHWQS